MKKIKMRDVANLAGVSVATVSRVLSDAHVVATETKERVLQVVNETGYEINRTAQNLSLMAEENIGLVINKSLYNTKYFTEVITQCTRFAESVNKKLIIAESNESANEEKKIISFLESQQCAVIITSPIYLSSTEIDLIIESSKANIIIINRTLEKHTTHCVKVDYYNCTSNLLDLLFKYNLKSIALFGGFSTSKIDEEILKSYKKSIEKLKQPYERKYIIDCNREFPASKEAMTDLIMKGVNPSAIITCNSDILNGVIMAINENKSDMSPVPLVITFDEGFDILLEYMLINVIEINYSEVIKEVLNKARLFVNCRPVNVSKQIQGKIVLRDFIF